MIIISGKRETETVHHQNRYQSGFTLIEVVIAIAIGAMILAAVLVFVPTVQENRRDSQRKDNIAKIVSTVEQYASDNGGGNPTAAQLNARLTSDNSIRDPNTGTTVQVTSGSCPSGATAVGTYIYQAATGAASYKVCTLLESGSVSTN
jgi:prepilin-type N-terminal cleavage/methylation domain-containing protein